MTQPPEPLVEESLECIVCRRAKAEPDQDGDLLYYTCPECGSSFGYQHIVPDGPVCAAGLPLAVSPPEDRAVFLGPTILRRPQ